jgi:hypothetical protein
LEGRGEDWRGNDRKGEEMIGQNLKAKKRL